MIIISMEGIKLFNYYNRIARYAMDLENNGKVERAEQLREILKAENRCIICGRLKAKNSNSCICDVCKIGNKTYIDS